MTAHYVYRVYSATGQCIYVGCTNNLRSRLRAHSEFAAWASDAAKVQAVVMPSKRAGLDLERRIIRELQPLWNVKGRNPKDPAWTVDDFEQFARARIGAQEVPAWAFKRADEMNRECVSRFGRGFTPELCRWILDWATTLADREVKRYGWSHPFEPTELGASWQEAVAS